MTQNMDLAYARVASSFFGQPLLLSEEQGMFFGQYLASRMLGIEAPAPQGNRFIGEEEFSDRTGRPKGFARIGSNIARVGLMGELVTRGAWMNSYSGMTSYEGFCAQLSNAVADDTIETILLDINTPGGAAYGMIDAARAIRAAAQKKRVIASVHPMALSAGYGLASGASEIVVMESGAVGSIGVLLVHFDHSKRLENLGVTTTIIHAGKRKVDGNPFGPLEGDALTSIQKRVDSIMTDFVGLVSEHRKISEKAIRDLEAEVVPAKDAVNIGLADRIGTFESIVTDLTSAPAGRTLSQNRRPSMSETTSAPAAENAGIPKAEHDAAVNAAGAEGASAERERIKAILGSEEAQGRAALAQHFAFNTAMSPEDAKAALAAAPVEAASGAAPEQTFEGRKQQAAAGAVIDMGGPAPIGEQPRSGLSKAIDRYVGAQR
ncbi:S49 family peptidase [Breoghania sp.]|uniref:S49 family peptidase n=1 Tax=Breoghania sp. TaxID=2065378 RepID=UPI002AAB778D|nr:S49 family peptidase [Breoghania sp.]